MLTEKFNKLFIGASGLLGRNCIPLLEDNIFTPSRIELDISSEENIKSFFKAFPIELDEVIISAAITDVIGCNCVKKDLALQVNGKAPGIIAREAIKHNKNILITYISSDYVFNGNSGGYYEYESINPVYNNYYAFTKAAGEMSLSVFKNVRIIRTSFCDNIWPYDNAFEDQFTSRDTISIIGPLISSYINSVTIGIVHIGTKRKSVYELARRLKPDVKPSSRLDVIKRTGVNIPYDTSLRSCFKLIEKNKG